MITIKFRGQDIETDEWLYGDLIQRLGYYPVILTNIRTEINIMKPEDKEVPGRKITKEYWADGEWHYEYKTFHK